MDDIVDEKRAKGRDAEALLANPVLVEAFEKIEAGVKEKFASPDLSKEDTHALWLFNKCFLALRTFIEKTSRTGKIAELEIPEVRATPPRNPQEMKYE